MNDAMHTDKQTSPLCDVVRELATRERKFGKKRCEINEVESHQKQSGFRSNGSSDLDYDPLNKPSCCQNERKYV